jgi:hypothetical protein
VPERVADATHAFGPGGLWRPVRGRRRSPGCGPPSGRSRDGASREPPPSDRRSLRRLPEVPAPDPRRRRPRRCVKTRLRTVKLAGQLTLQAACEVDEPTFTILRGCRVQADRSGLEVEVPAFEGSGRASRRPRPGPRCGGWRRIVGVLTEPPTLCRLWRPGAAAPSRPHRGPPPSWPLGPRGRVLGRRPACAPRSACATLRSLGTRSWRSGAGRCCRGPGATGGG